MSIDPATILAIAAMAVVTAATRLAGLWLVRVVQPAGRVAAALEAVPAAVLMSVIAPTIFLKGPAEAIAAAVTLLVAFRAPMMVAVVAGVACVVALRHVLN
jgi:uncharacterized membrane protein